MPAMRDPFQLGEDRFLAWLASRFRARGGSAFSLGIGDDAAVLAGRPARVVTVDQMLEGRHFRFRWIVPRALGRRAVERALSDIAAMGARPEGVLLALSWPRGGEWGRKARALFEGLGGALDRRGVPLVGGDTTRARVGHAALAVVAVGRPWPGGPVLRSGGRPGDLLAVTGPLGAAAAGHLLCSGRLAPPGDRAGRRAAGAALRAFREPTARLELARPLARHARALIDLSDGLGLDLPRLAAASGCGFEVEAERIPVAPAARRLLGERRAFRAAIAGGEDYELLAAIPPDRLPAAERAVARAGGALHVVGRLTAPGGGGRLVRRGAFAPWPAGGWDPFRPPLDAGRPGRVDRAGRRRSGRR
ncbi:MAG: thiamine-phosphate kinase [Acidobacteria bacterium]|nr:MAG: thiamine-phosphate kinase [Acidobacteriota bacterium]